jgi:starch synthase (maltosyl-transferring)
LQINDDFYILSISPSSGKKMPAIQIIQDPAPGTRLVRFCGDVLNFTLRLPQAEAGTAWVRTNIGQAKVIREEIIREVEKNETPLGKDWFDIPMQRADDRSFKAVLPLCEVGHFEAKSFFLKEGELQPSWPPGDNTAVNVEPADACCANIIYNAFVRQFGPNKAGKQKLEPSDQQCIRKLDKDGYAVIPPSGTFRDLIAELDFIIGELGCRMLLLLPIHPTPTTYGRMGRFGSPYAALSFTAVDPALAEFDPHATPLEQFIELVDAVHQRNAEILIDIAINHTGWAASLHESHPQWLVRSPEGRIEIPGAWGVAWEDLTKLDYSKSDLWRYMADVFIQWCRRGVDGFRCDAGYMIPLAAWKYIVARVRQQFPNVVFLLEGLGGKISATRALLNLGNLNCCYSELFQNYDRIQIEHYLPESIDISGTDGLMVHFAETHDNPRLAQRSKVYARMRTALCALSSQNGAFGFANGVEWFAAEKIDVHDAISLNWGAKSNQVAEIRRLNHLLKVHPVFHEGAVLSLHQRNEGNFIVLLRQHPGSGKKLLVIVNLDSENRTPAAWDPASTGLKGPEFYDLLTGSELKVFTSDNLHTLVLNPGQVLCLSPDPRDLEQIREPGGRSFLLPDRIERQRLHAKVLELVSACRGTRHVGDLDLADCARRLRQNPLDFCRRLQPQDQQPQIITWRWPQDLRREVMLPPGHLLLVHTDCAFSARIMDAERAIATEQSLPADDRTHFALFLPLAAPRALKYCTLALSVYDPAGCRHAEAPLLVLPRPQDVRVKQQFKHSELLQKDFILLAGNGRGAMLHSAVSWGNLTSRYDALLAANMNPHYPEDRQVMFTRCRAWAVFQGYSQALNTDCLDNFRMPATGGGLWQYHIPTGQGEYVLITLRVEMIADQNEVRLHFFRHPAENQAGRLADFKPVQIILRPDIENRNFHATTKAYQGPEHQWPGCLSAFANGFDFIPDADHHFRMEISAGAFVWEPEWFYMVYRPKDAGRGLDPDSDLFSPGYLSVFIEGNQTVTLVARVGAKNEMALPASPAGHSMTGCDSAKIEPEKTITEVLRAALDHYVVTRGDLKTVIAGYPWFLDWGRDALIFARGLVAAGKTADARDILKQFGRFEKDGTLPNMIQGDNAANRDTSDAPLWFITACGDLIRAEKSSDFLSSACGDRSVKEVILSIGRWLKAGTPNGVRMDPESGLIFSPIHFTWMDTNYPAGTPRQGYPVEIQALWYAAICLLAEIDAAAAGNQWRQLAQKVQNSITAYFWQPDLGYLSDCLQASGPDRPAKDAVPDDALRPNQLLAITLGAVHKPDMCRQILSACEELLVPGAIRSLADRPVRNEIKIVHQGKIINDPRHPYQGRYEGDEDTRRKPAYHNGTAWTWIFPSFCEAWAMTYGKQSRQTALAWLASSRRLLEQGCLGHIPEILDGDYPHTQRGCDAQAWGSSELLRVWLKLAED